MKGNTKYFKLFSVFRIKNKSDHKKYEIRNNSRNKKIANSSSYGSESNERSCRGTKISYAGVKTILLKEKFKQHHFTENLYMASI